jgi:4-hydroxythreonine-4-phosphate dehydrogenase
MSKPRIAITMGDPAGVGPEICLDLLADEAVAKVCTPVVLGDRGVLEKCATLTGKRAELRFIEEAEISQCDEAAVVSLSDLLAEGFQPGVVNEQTGRAAYEFITKSIELALAGAIDGVATAPIHKEALRAAGVAEPGHTEIFANRTQAQRSCMMLTAESITCSLVTVHVGYDEVPGLLSVARIFDVIELTRAAMRRLRGREPKLVVCGLNPHAGEGGLFGNREEETLIEPAIERARAAGMDIEGPLPPDTAFIAARRATTDAYVCMYHDQGLIPLKALAFDDAINVTLGLPIVRTSVDHGTALDIAWQGKAKPDSLVAAVLLAARLAGE